MDKLVHIIRITQIHRAVSVRKEETHIPVVHLCSHPSVGQVAAFDLSESLISTHVFIIPLLWSKSRIMVLKAEVRSTNGILTETRGTKRFVLTVFIEGNIGKAGEFERASLHQLLLSQTRMPAACSH